MPLFPNGGGSPQFGSVGGPVLTAALPAAASATNQFYWASDWGAGGSLVRSNGTRWKAVNNKTLLGSLDAASSNIGNSDTIVFQVALPIGVWQVNDVLELIIGVTKSGTTDSANFNWRIGTTGTIADTAVFSTAALMAAANQQVGTRLSMRLNTATTAQGQPPTAATWGFNTGNGVFGGGTAISNATTNALFSSVSISSSSTNNTVAQVMGQLWLNSSAN